MTISNVYISVTEGRRQLVVDGPLDLFRKFFLALINPHDLPCPNMEVVTPPNRAIS